MPNSEVLAWPVQRYDVSPVSDGAVAIIMAAEHIARRVTDKPVWVEGVAGPGDSSLDQPGSGLPAHVNMQLEWHTIWLGSANAQGDPHCRATSL
jgi:acetyl-CoA acetyltransferase